MMATVEERLLAVEQAFADPELQAEVIAALRDQVSAVTAELNAIKTSVVNMERSTLADDQNQVYDLLIKTFGNGDKHYNVELVHPDNGLITVARMQVKAGAVAALTLNGYFTDRGIEAKLQQLA